MSSLAQTTNEPTLGQRLRRRREDFGASVEQVAAWAGVDAARLETIEAGGPIGSSELETVCRALAVDSGALIRGEDRSPRRSVARFRSASWIDPEPEDFRNLALAAELGRIGGFLANRLGYPNRLPHLRAPIPVATGEKPWKQGYRLGENARRALAPSHGPIRELEGLLTTHGVHVAQIEFSSPDLDAASLWERDSLPVILMNRRSPRVGSTLSRRALLAHELCHLLHDSGDRQRDLTTQLSWSEDAGSSGNYTEALEKRARAFAPAFLAPRDEVGSWFQRGQGRRVRDPYKKVEMLAREWGLSIQGAIWHAKNCRIIQPSTAERLNELAAPQDHDWAADFERSPLPESAASENGAVSPIAQGFLSTLVAEASSTGVISEGRGREIVTWA